MRSSHRLRWTLRVVAVIAMLVSLPVATAAEPPENLVANPSFEATGDGVNEQRIAEWSLKFRAGPDAPALQDSTLAVVSDAAQAHSGKRFVRLGKPQVGATMLTAPSHTRVLRPGLYEFSAWMRGRPGTKGAMSNHVLGWGAGFEVSSEQWTRFNARLLVDAPREFAEAPAVSIEVWASGDRGQIAEPQVDLDDVCVRELTCGLADVFGDHMVLQRDKPLPIWGWAKDAGRKVTATLNGQSRTVEADPHGRWIATFDPMPAGGPYVVELDGFAVAQDVMLGDVWLCSGQSNMEMGVDKIHGIFGTAPEVIAGANHPRIRLWQASHQVNVEPMRAYQLRQSGGLMQFQACWKTCSPASVAQGIWGGYSVIGYFFGRELEERENVAIGLVQVTRGGTPIEAWLGREALAAIPKEQWVAVAQGSLDVADKKRVNVPVLPEGRRVGSTAYDEMLVHQLRWDYPIGDVEQSAFQTATACYNGMLAPLTPMALKGVLWYQGEHNGGDPHYAPKLTAVIESWRKAFGDEKLPFVVAQLCNWKTDEAGQNWPLVREAQLNVVQQLPRTALAVTIDLADREGEGYGPSDIHPRNKADVAHRMALAARRIAYDEKIEHSGPIYQIATKDGARLRVKFQHIGGGLVVRGDRLVGFEIAGSDKKFVPANAVIDGSGVLVSSRDVAEPQFVRYCFKQFVEPMGSLYNKEGLPASPFRSDR